MHTVVVAGHDRMNIKKFQRHFNGIIKKMGNICIVEAEFQSQENRHRKKMPENGNKKCHVYFRVLQ